MEKLKKRISNAIETELARVFDELAITSCGDITPEQFLRWEKLANDFAALFAELIKQNK